MRNGRELKTGKKYEYMFTDRKRILMIHNVTEEDVGIYECVLADDRMSIQLSLKGKLTEKALYIFSYHRAKSTVSLPWIVCWPVKQVSLICCARSKDDCAKGTGLSMHVVCLRPCDILKFDLL